MGGLFAIAAAVVNGLAADPPAGDAVTEFENSARLLISLLHEPHAACVTPDGALLATGHDDGAIVLWSTESGLPVRSFEGHADTVAALAVDASGSRLASAGYDATVRVWSITGDESVLSLLGHTGRLNSVAFSPDGNRLASGGYDRTVRLWNLARPDGESIVLSGHDAAVRTIAFAPDEGRIASGDNAGTIRLWNVSDASEAASAEAHSGPVQTLLFTPDGETVFSGGDDGAVMQWNAATLERQAPSDGDSRPSHSDPVTGMAMTPDGRLLATGDQRGHVQTWDLSTGRATSSLNGHDDEISGIAFLANGESLLTVSFDRTVNVWRSKIPVTPRLAMIDDVDVRLWSLAVAPDDATLFTGGRESFLVGWSLESGRQLIAFKGFDGTVDAVALSADGSHIACCGWREERIVVFDTDTGNTAAETTTDTKVRCVRFSPDGEWLVAGGEDGTLRIWPWRTDEGPRTIPTGALAVYDVAFSPDGTQLVSCTGDWRNPVPGQVTFWNAGAWSEIRAATEHTHAVRSVTFNSDGTRVASAGEDGLVILWHAETHVPLARLQNGTGVRPVAFSPDGTRLAVGLHDGTINVWDTDRGEVVQRFQTEDDVFGVAYSRDGSVLFSVSGEERIEVWPTENKPDGSSTAGRIAGWNAGR